MKWLHISDMHFDPSNDGRATRDLREKFETYVKEKNICDVDEVFFTGDFRHAFKQRNQDADTVAQNAIEFLRWIAYCVGVTETQHIHIVPGNHDLDRECNQESNKIILNRIYEQYEYNEGRFTGNAYDNITSTSYLLNRFGFFEKCIQLIDNKVWNNFKEGPIHRFKNFDGYSIVYLNTAISSGRNSDRHNLLIGLDDFDKAIRNTNVAPLIILGHNPLFHLDRNEQNIIKNILRDNGAPVVWLCGDIHEVHYDKSYDIACISTGCLIKQKGTKASFFVGQIEKYKGISIDAYAYAAEHGYWQAEEAITKRVKESIPDSLLIKSGCMPINNNIPERNTYFAGRDKYLYNIAQTFKINEKIVIKQSISGLGGIGKTQLAREYAYRYCENYKYLIWEINSESKMTVYNDFVLLAQKLNLELHQDFKENELQNAIKKWMQENRNWLIIFDNLEDQDIIAPYQPKNRIGGNILITSRNSNLRFETIIDLETFTVKEAIEFLDNRLIGCDWLEKYDIEIKTDLVERLGRLPLALEQAAAYIKVTRTKYYRYLNILEESGLKAFEFDETDFNKPEYYEKSVTTTWEISFSAIVHEGAKQLFYLCSFMAPEKIPVYFFTNNRKILPQPISDDLATVYSTNKIVTELRMYSLTGGDSEYINIHRLVQEVVRKKVSSDSSWLICCLSLMQTEFIYEWGNITAIKTFAEKASHALSISRNSEIYLSDSDKAMADTACLYQEIGTGFMNCGKYSDSETFLKKALEIRKKILNIDHPDIANTYNELALLYDCIGDYTTAIKKNKKALEIRLKVMGNENLFIAISYNNMALFYTHQGYYEKALKWYKMALAINEKILGNNHPDTAVIYNNIAAVHYRRGSYQESLEWHYKVLGIRKKVLGEEHLDIATTYSNMASAYHQQGDYPRALELHRKALIIKEKVLGEKHPITATTYDGIAYEYYHKNDNSRALEWYQKAVEIREEKLGYEHPDTATTYNNIGLVYSSQGNDSKAFEYYKKALKIREIKLGEGHPHTATVYNNIANMYLNQNEYQKALAWYEKALIIRTNVLGLEHPATASTYNCLGILYSKNGRYSEALDWYQKALKIRLKKLGENHPDTKATKRYIDAIIL